MSSTKVVGVNGNNIAECEFPADVFKRWATIAAPAVIHYADGKTNTIAELRETENGTIVRVKLSSAARRIIGAQYGAKLNNREIAASEEAIAEGTWTADGGSPLILSDAAGKAIALAVTHAMHYGTRGVGCGVTDHNVEAVIGGWKVRDGVAEPNPDAVKNFAGVARPSVTRHDVAVDFKAVAGGKTVATGKKAPAKKAKADTPKNDTPKTTDATPEAAPVEPAVA